MANGANQSRSLEAEILLKAWEMLQGLAKSNGESAWNVRAWAVSVWAALVAYAYKSDRPQIVVVAIVQLVACFVVELGIRQVQYRFIQKSIAIERALNSYWAGDKAQLPDTGVSTNLETPTLEDIGNLLSPKRWLIWFPYVLLLGASLLMLGIWQAVTGGVSPT
jgi:hypothetical protein